MSITDDTPAERQIISLCDTNDENVSVVLNGNLSIAEAVSLREELAEIVALGKGVTLHGESIERIDTAALQVLAAFTHELMELHLSLKWVSASESLVQAASLLGLTAHVGLKAQ